MKRTLYVFSVLTKKVEKNVNFPITSWWFYVSCPKIEGYDGLNHSFSLSISGFPCYWLFLDKGSPLKVIAPKGNERIDYGIRVFSKQNDYRAIPARKPYNRTQIFVSPLLPNHILFLIVAFHSKTGRWSREGQTVQLLLVQLVYFSLRYVPNTKLSLPCSLFLSETFQLPQLSFIYNMFFSQNM